MCTEREGERKEYFSAEYYTKYHVFPSHGINFCMKQVTEGKLLTCSLCGLISVEH